MPGITIDDPAEAEGDDLVFTVTLSAAAGVDVTVNYQTADDTATAGSDYTAQSNVATIPAGSTTASVTVPSTEDALFETDETFFVNLSGASNASIADDQGTGTIQNDDGPSADLSISKTTAATTFEPGDQITYTITVENEGPNDATSLTVTDVLPPGLTLVSASGTGWTCNGTTTVTCTLPVLAADATSTITLVATASGSASITNTATVSAASADDAPGNNSAFAVVAPAAVAGAGIPTLSEWALMLLALMLVGAAIRRI